MKKSAGILLYRISSGAPEFFLVHPGGPFWKNKDAGAWSIPKGEFTEEDPLEAALREFYEETGFRLKGKPIALTPVQQKGGKWIYAFALEGDLEPDAIISNNFTIEWPYKSGKMQSFPEVDKAGWFSGNEAQALINPSQSALLVELSELLQAR